jgi:hypothetical protein
MRIGTALAIPRADRLVLLSEGSGGGHSPPYHLPLLAQMASGSHLKNFLREEHRENTMRRTHLYSDRVRILLLLVLLGSLSALFIEIALQSSQLLGNYVVPVDIAGLNALSNQ